MKLARDLDLFKSFPTITTPPSLPPIPDTIPCVSMWGAWASAIADGRKTIETRTWSIIGTWLAFHCTQRWDAPLLGACLAPPPLEPRLPAGVVFALAPIRCVRELLEQDAPAAGIYRAGLRAHVLGDVFLLRPFLRLKRGYQKLGKLDGKTLAIAAGLTPEGGRTVSIFTPNDWLASRDPWPIADYPEKLPTCR